MVFMMVLQFLFLFFLLWYTYNLYLKCLFSLKFFLFVLTYHFFDVCFLFCTSLYLLKNNACQNQDLMKHVLKGGLQGPLSRQLPLFNAFRPSQVNEILNVVILIHIDMILLQSYTIKLLCFAFGLYV